MSIDRLRLAESATEAVLVLAALTLPATEWVVLGVAAVMLTSGVYALHAVTFDCFRLTGQRAERNFASTKGKD